jgi:hypothetical protein
MVTITSYEFLVLEHMEMSVADMLMFRQYPPLNAVVITVLEALKVIHGEITSTQVRRKYIRIPLAHYVFLHEANFSSAA